MKRPLYYITYVAVSAAAEICVLEGMKVLAKGFGVCDNVPPKFILFGGAIYGVANTAFRLTKDYKNDKKEESNESRKEQEV
jgi:hypothetical protein